MSFPVSSCNDCPMEVENGGRSYCRLFHQDEEEAMRFMDDDGVMRMLRGNEVTEYVLAEKYPSWCMLKKVGKIEFEFVGDREEKEQPLPGHLRVIK